jgi:hypothetical protein
MAEDGADTLLELLNLLKDVPEPLAYGMLRHWRTFNDAPGALAVYQDRQADMWRDFLTMTGFELELATKNPVAYPYLGIILPAHSTAAT